MSDHHSHSRSQSPPASQTSVEHSKTDASNIPPPISGTVGPTDSRIRGRSLSPAECRKERALLGLMGMFRNKKNWPAKVTNEDILVKWKEEILSGRSESHKVLSSEPGEDAEDGGEPSVAAGGQEESKADKSDDGSDALADQQEDEKAKDGSAEEDGFAREWWMDHLQNYVQPHPDPEMRGDFEIEGYRKSTTYDLDFVVRQLELDLDEVLKKDEKDAVKQLIEEMRSARTISWDLMEGRFSNRGIMLDTPRELIRTFWSDELWNFAVAECLREIEDCKNFDAPPEVVAAAVKQAYQADDYITPEELAELKRLVAILEDVPEHQKDYHPGSNGQVLDLVHPSLFCFIKGVTRCLAEPVISASPEDWLATAGSGVLAAEDDTDPRYDHDGEYSAFSTQQVPSDDFQWLPAEFDVDASGSVKPLSYIVGLHPVVHADGYKAIVKILEKFVPLFGRVVTDIVAGPRENRLSPFAGYHREFEGHDDEHDQDDEEDGDVDEFAANLLPDLPPVDEPFPARTFVVDLKGSRLQVIVKLASIHLTPDKPEYKGGSWHTEATGTEGIVATGIYYYDTDNITASRLAFRRDVTDHLDNYEQNARWAVRQVWGLADGFDATIHIGEIDAITGRCIAFPNTYQHRVEPFRLVDPSKPGHRKILAFFLVDPSRPSLSTARVPPQNAEWAVDALGSAAGKQFASLPVELLGDIVHRAGFMTGAEAREHREALMTARAANLVKNNGYYYSGSVSLCEH
ncbi:hypothetical protein HDU88_001582 [Geranomyces variabilis]|nr:hypothetical protein HDU88_001582 [Geranomyces variabilis]